VTTNSIPLTVQTSRCQLHGPSSGGKQGFFVGDELTAQGLPFADLEAVVNAVAASLAAHPELPATARIIYYNDSIFAAAWPYIPHNLTYFSLDYYHGLATGRVNETVWDLYNLHVFPKLGPATKVLFVPQAFGSAVDTRPGYTLATYEGWALGNLTEYIRWSALDERVVGFNPWHLLDRPGPTNASACAQRGSEFGCCEIGVIGMPRLHAALVALGKEVVGNWRRSAIALNQFQPL